MTLSDLNFQPFKRHSLRTPSGGLYHETRQYSAGQFLPRAAESHLSSRRLAGNGQEAQTEMDKLMHPHEG
jgi:hypothetical protein